MSMYNNVFAATETIREKMALAALRSGRKINEIQLLAVTKFHPLEAVFAAYDAGIRLFGENRVQEAELKFRMPEAEKLSGSSLHMIGNLQSNKIAKAVGLFDVIQSIDDQESLAKVTSRALAIGKTLSLYLELHTGEATKGGFKSIDDMLFAVDGFLQSIQGSFGTMHPGCVSIQGLMTMAPFLADGVELRQSFRSLAGARRAILDRFHEIPELQLSMGMSGDFEVAIEEGSTMIRIGSALFGDRNTP